MQQEQTSRVVADLPQHVFGQITRIFQEELDVKGQNLSWDDKTTNVLKRLNSEGYYISSTPGTGSDER